MGDYDCKMLATLIPAFEGKKCIAIAAGREHSLVLTSKNEVVAFGCGLSGQIGVGSDNSVNACHAGPVDTQLSLTVGSVLDVYRLWWRTCRERPRPR